MERIYKTLNQGVAGIMAVKERAMRAIDDFFDVAGMFSSSEPSYSTKQRMARDGDPN